MEPTTWLYDFRVLLSIIVLQTTRLVGAVVTGILALLYGLEVLPEVIINLEDTDGGEGGLIILIIGMVAGSVGVTCAVWRGLGSTVIGRYLSSGTPFPATIKPFPRISEIPSRVGLWAVVCLGVIVGSLLIHTPPALDAALASIATLAACAWLVTVTRWLNARQTRVRRGLHGVRG